MLLNKNIQKITFENHSTDGMLEFYTDKYEVQINGNFLEVSFKEYASLGTQEEPTTEKTSVFLVKLTKEIEQTIKELSELFIHHKFHKEDNYFDYYVIKIFTSDGVYEVDVNAFTTKLFIDFLKKINAPSKINMVEILSWYELIQSKEDTNFESKDEPILEPDYPYIFTYTNSAIKSRVEIKIYFDYKNGNRSGFKVLCKTISKKDDVYSIDEKTSVLPSSDDLKNEFIKFFKIFFSKKDQYSEVEDDYCSISYCNKNVKFSRKFFTSDFYDLLDYVFLGDESLKIPVEKDKFSGKHKYLFFRSNPFFDVGSYSEDSDIEYIKFIDDDYAIDDYCFCNCPNLKEVTLVSKWWSSKQDLVSISPKAFNNNPKMKMIGFE